MAATQVWRINITYGLVGFIFILLSVGLFYLLQIGIFALFAQFDALTFILQCILGKYS